MGRLVKARFAWDEETISFRGWHDPTERWNGFATPAFEKAEADRLAAFQNTMPAEAGRLAYDAAQDAYLHDQSATYPGEEPEAYRGFDQEGRHLYAIGSWAWTWTEVDEPEPGALQWTGPVPQLRGEVCDRTDIECPTCKAQGQKTVGGYTPRLIRLPRREPWNWRLACMSHGIFEAEPPEARPVQVTRAQAESLVVLLEPWIGGEVGEEGDQRLMEALAAKVREAWHLPPPPAD